jgi:hypothetical protein
MYVATGGYLLLSENMKLMMSQEILTGSGDGRDEDRLNLALFGYTMDKMHDLFYMLITGGRLVCIHKSCSVKRVKITRRPDFLHVVTCAITPAIGRVGIGDYSPTQLVVDVDIEPHVPWRIPSVA